VIMKFTSNKKGFTQTPTSVLKAFYRYLSSQHHSIKQNLVSGFTLVETLVAISILMLAVTGPVYFASESLKAAIYARDQITAFYLAQDAFEQIRGLRVNNIANNSPWLNGISGVCDSLCKIDPYSNLNSNSYPLACGSDCGQIKKTLDGRYGYGSNSDWTDTPFNRSIKVETTETDNGTPPSATEVKVTVTITWRSGTIDRVFTAYEFLRNVS